MRHGRRTSLSTTSGHDAAIGVRNQVTFYLDLGEARVFEVVELGERNHILADFVVAGKVDRVFEPFGEHDLETVLAANVLSGEELDDFGGVVQA
jgi:hypothetical protein